MRKQHLLSAPMIAKLGARGQITIPARVLTTLGVQPGEYLELRAHPEGFILCRHQTIDRTRLAPLRKKLRKGKGRFDLEPSRSQSGDLSLRD